MERARRQDRKKINQALESAQRILGSDSPASLEEIDGALSILQNAERNGYPFADLSIIRGFEDRRRVEQGRTLESRSDQIRGFEDAELARIETEITEIIEQMKKMDEEAAKTLLGRIQMGLSAVVGFELSSKKEALSLRLRELYRRKREIERN